MYLHVIVVQIIVTRRYNTHGTITHVLITQIKKEKVPRCYI